MRENTWSAMKLAATAPTLGGIPIGNAARVSTGEPNPMMLARSFDLRYAAVW
ncbi:hypothetical protein BN1047_02819 [Mycolicibacterium neoaurum]|uniref:Uncharacterized protein n=1 Tax=Mycolicibacterium neoaurum TaxID=1795 RepID=A0AAV2WKU4_MYCNE|nr:hypothetical protein BN1047_02819 [Mycolicibacterium neoaurum]